MDDESTINERQPLIQNSVNEDIVFQDDQSCCTVFFDPRRKFYRYFCLVFICTMCFGSYFCYVLPGALEQELEKGLRISTTEFTAFTSLYSWPNVVLCLIGGYLIDRILGVRKSAILFSTFVTSGQLIFSYGAFADKVWLMDIGRFVFGMGGESLSVSQKAYAVTWFSSEELNLVFGMMSSVALLGSSVNQIVMAPIYNYVATFESGPKCLGIVLFIATVPCIISSLSALILSPLDRRRKRILKLDKRNDFASTSERSMRFIDTFKFPPQIWLMIVICVCFYSLTFPFISLGKLFFIRKYNCDPYIASLQQSLFFLATVVTSPLFGLIVDYTGYNLFWVIAAIIMALASHVILMFTWINSFVPVLLLGMSLSLLATALWPMVSLLVSKNQLGTAYGLMQAIQNLGLAIFSIFTGLLLQNYGYFVLELFFIILCIISLVAAFILYFVDNSKNGTLSLSKSKREELTL